MNDFCPDDAICPDDPTCMECGNICKKSEIVWTGDQNSYKGWDKHLPNEKYLFISKNTQK
jgi:hypothetical protein